MKRDNLGTYESDVKTNRKIREYFAREESLDLSGLEQAVSIILRLFSELETQKGKPVERISDKEIRRRFSKARPYLKQIGYELKSISKMNRDEAWAYLQVVRRDLRAQKQKFRL